MVTEACSHLIDGVLYDTANAKLVHAAFYDDCEQSERFEGMMRHLMRDLSGRYFLFDLIDTESKRPLWRISPLSISEARQWCLSSDMDKDELEEHFPTQSTRPIPSESVALLSSSWRSQTSENET